MVTTTYEGIYKWLGKHHQRPRNTLVAARYSVARRQAAQGVTNYSPALRLSYGADRLTSALPAVLGSATSDLAIHATPGRTSLAPTTIARVITALGETR